MSNESITNVSILISVLVSITTLGMCLFGLIVKRLRNHFGIVNGFATLLIGIAALFLSVLNLIKISEVNYNINNYYGIGYPEEMLDRARVKYNADDVGGAVDIYMNLFLKDNPTACCNMGYLYANGIYVEKSLDLARRYFEHAIESGDETARLEILAMYLENDMSQAIKYLEENADIEIIVQFFQDNFEDVSLFWESDAGKQAEILQEKFLLQEESIEEYQSAQSSNDWVKFELIGSRQELDERNSVYKTMYTYRVYRWKLKEPERLGYEIK